ncbi:type VI secretion protein, VC_A0114 family [Rhodopirellula europaea 6C]|uniref:Type VI secretion protein, VC_A0114 family n=2 Tax=Rhodopirellula TaxID=265488 RepID=M2B4F2_9BACT|nr:type VI secretion protein, VC_A0114 family [Rhodopirellula europaea 6C]
MDLTAPSQRSERNPMQNLAVHWHEGLFLRPHHLQAWDRHWQESQAASSRWQNPYSYGLASISINADALALGFFQLDGVRAKMPEGTLVELAVGESTERVDLRAGFAVSGATPSTSETSDAAHETIPVGGGDSVDVFLAVPRLQLGVSNVAEGDQAEGARFRQLQIHVPDETDGASVEPVLFRRVNAVLKLSTEDLTGYDVLRIARVKRGTVGGAIAELDERYVPPLMDCAAWSQMRQRFLRPIHDMMMLKIELLSQLVNDRSVRMDAEQPGDLQRILMLQTLNQAAAVLGVLNQSSGVHPWNAYVELSRVAGGLDLFGETRSLQAIAAYDHDAIGPLFQELRRRIESRIAAVGQNAYQQRFFIGAGLGMQVSLDPQWLTSDWQCVLGVRRGKLSAAGLDKLLSPGFLDWKMGSARQVETLYSKRAMGLELKPLREVPRVLPSQSDWSFFEISGRGPAWTDVLDTGTIALRIREQLIDDPQKLAGNQTLKVRMDAHTTSLQFAIFATKRSDSV